MPHCPKQIRDSNLLLTNPRGFCKTKCYLGLKEEHSYTIFMLLDVTKYMGESMPCSHRSVAQSQGRVRAAFLPPDWFEGSVGRMVVCVPPYVKVTSLSWFILTWSWCVHSTSSVMHKSAQNEDKVPLCSLTEAIPVQKGSGAKVNKWTDSNHSLVDGTVQLKHRHLHGVISLNCQWAPLDTTSVQIDFSIDSGWSW